MEQRLYDLIYKLKHVETGKNLSIIELKDLISQKNIIGMSPKYSNTELAIVFDYYSTFYLLKRIFVALQELVVIYMTDINKAMIVKEEK